MKKIILLLLLFVALPFVATTAATASPSGNTYTLPRSVEVLDAKNQLVEGLMNVLDRNRNSLFQSITKCVLKQVVASSLATRSSINTADYLNNPSVFAILTEHDAIMRRAQTYLGSSVPIPS